MVKVFAYRTITVSGAHFHTLQLTYSNLVIESRYPVETFVPTVWAIPLSLAATKGVTVLFYFLPGTKMFQFPGLPHSTLFYSGWCHRHSLGGVAPFGHPRILALTGSSWNFAVSCVLHRLLAPRYPPCALCSLTKCLVCGRIQDRSPTGNQDLKHWYF